MKEINGYQNIFNHEMTPMYDELTGKVIVKCNSCEGIATETIVDSEHCYRCSCRDVSYSYNDSFLETMKGSV